MVMRYRARIPENRQATIALTIRQAKLLASETLLETVVAIYEGSIGRIAFDESADRTQLAQAATVVLDRLPAG